MKMVCKLVLVMGMISLAVPGVVLGRELSLDRAYDQAVAGDSTSSMISLVLGPTEGQTVKDQGKDKGKDKGTRGQKKAPNPDWGGFGGPVVQYIWLDLSALDPMTDDRGLDAFDNNMLLIGGAGGMIYKDFRFGGFGFGNGQETADRVLGKRRSAQVDLGGGGLFFESNRTLSPNFGLDAGLMVGAGSISLKAFGNDLGPDRDWNADASFAFGYPYLGFWVAPAKWMWIQVNGGYMYFQVDHELGRFENDLGKDMVDDDLRGGAQVSLSINFGHNPNIK